MDIAPITRTAVSDVVYTRIVEEILSGRIAPGDSLPSERELSLSFQVNRHAIREALKRIRQTGLIQISQGGRTRVSDWRENAGLDTLSAVVAAGVVPPLELLRDVVVMQRSIGADAARQCAVNASDEQLEDVMAAARAYPEQGTAVDFALADTRFWIAVIEGTGNIVYRLAHNSLISAFSAINLPVVTEWPVNEFTDRASRMALAEIIADRDAEKARSYADRLLTDFVTRFESAARGE
ncbi:MULTISPECIES: FadR/GntR family transcriptional regulator [unclassified Nocardia]|uniref:FadR/GntR family transcriptional regulator n=1 Tax=unclassified Nocardia TaxID=2637762 RepID=UPI001CE3F611|nr:MULTISPECIES: GntR family transcriptional regulator [unclassified Nocardia]